MTAPQASAPRNVSKEEFALLIARPETRIIFISLTMFITGLVQGFRRGWNPGPLVLVGGAVLAVVGTLLFGGTLMRQERSFAAAGSALAGFGPYLFGTYLALYRGLWNGRLVFTNFSLASLAAAVAFLYFGYRLVYWTWQLTEIGEALRSGRLRVADDVPPT
jgi:hypothetical protein